MLDLLQLWRKKERNINNNSKTTPFSLNPFVWRQRKPDSHSIPAAIAAPSPHQIPHRRDQQPAPGLVEDSGPENGAGENGELPEAGEQTLKVFFFFKNGEEEEKGVRL